MILLEIIPCVRYKRICNAEKNRSAAKMQKSFTPLLSATTNNRITVRLLNNGIQQIPQKFKNRIILSSCCCIKNSEASAGMPEAYLQQLKLN